MLEYKDIWLHLDSSKIGDYMICPRYYFYKHILGWKIDSPNINLVFGEAWHRAKPYIFLNGVGRDNIENAMVAFLDYYRQYFSDATDMDNFPKNPGNALSALLLYENTFGDPTEEFSVVEINGKPAIELYGTVPISDTRLLHFRLDMVLQRRKDGLIVVTDHKTAGKNSPLFQSMYSMSTQMHTYYHVLNCLYTPSKVYGVMVDLTVFTKSSNTHIRIPIIKTTDMMSSWLWNVNAWYGAIERDVSILMNSCKSKNTIMTAFPKNDKGCVSYGRKCPFFDFCMAWSNPLSRCASPPSGFTEDFWDPSKVDEKANIINIKE